MNGATLLADAPAPGTPEWLRYMTGSKIAAVMRLSPYESYYSLWYRMAGIVAPEAETDIMRRGHYLEPGIRAWFVDQHPEFDVAPAGMWVSDQHPLYAVNPDALVIDRETGEVLVGEWKSALDKDVWGEELSDEIPVYYRCQVMWAMGILSLKRARIAVLGSYLDFREFEVRFDPSEFALLVKAADVFMASLAAREHPDIDSHKATYEVIKAMHPLIDPAPIELPTELAVRYSNAKADAKVADEAARLWTSKVAAHMGSYKTATYAGATIATRRSKKGGTPYVQAVDNIERLPLDLIDTTDLEEAS
jgi:putative phage-type endonuclease